MGVLKINERVPLPQKEVVRVVKSQRFFGGCLKTVEHRSHVNNCTMTFMIFLPESEIVKQRGSKPYPALYYLNGLSSNAEVAASKSNFALYAKKRNIAVVFPDTRPHGLDDRFPAEISFETGFGAGHYCDAT